MMIKIMSVDGEGQENYILPSDLFSSLRGRLPNEKNPLEAIKFIKKNLPNFNQGDIPALHSGLSRVLRGFGPEHLFGVETAREILDLAEELGFRIGKAEKPGEKVNAKKDPYNFFEVNSKELFGFDDLVESLIARALHRAGVEYSSSKDNFKLLKDEGIINKIKEFLAEELPEDSLENALNKLRQALSEFERNGKPVPGDVLGEFFTIGSEIGRQLGEKQRRKNENENEQK